jgi:O-acetyl-ADP-ribose deacetylase (regulator of RNase III)
MKQTNKDILTVEEGIIIHQVNARGVMGAGLALKIRRKWPVVWKVYRSDTPLLGMVQYVPVGAKLAVVNLCGQDGYGTDKRHTDYDAIADGLTTLAGFLNDFGMNDVPVYIPYGMGCGLGGGDWNVVSAIIEVALPQATICKI